MLRDADRVARDRSGEGDGVAEHAPGTDLNDVATTQGDASCWQDHRDLIEPGKPLGAPGVGGDQRDGAINDHPDVSGGGLIARGAAAVRSQVRAQAGAPEVHALAGMRRAGIEDSKCALRGGAIEDQPATDGRLRLSGAAAVGGDDARFASDDVYAE